ncbi:MAG: nucleoside recognition domain-containing protein, partial [bacterium]|nr:nucleoside recognition domain-containing protein [bacterium]
SIVVWILQSFDISLHVNTDNSQSIMAVIGRKIAPIFVPCGFGFWQASVGLLSGIIAKESIVSTLGIMCTTAGIQELFTPVSALAFVSFVCLYIPCVASIYTISRELKSVKTTALLLFFQLFVAWVMSFVVFRIGCLII